MNADWPKKVHVGGETYRIHPDMPMSEFTEVTDAFQNEGDKITELLDAMGYDVPTPGDSGFGGGDP